MVKKYLENYLNELLEKKIDLENQYSLCENHIRENIEFIKLLEEKSDPNYESFTPRVVNSANRKKIDELKQKQKSLMEEADQKKLELEDYEAKIAELSSVIKSVREDERNTSLTSIEDSDISKLKILEIQESERQRIAMELQNSTVQNLTSFLHKMELCSRLVSIDPNRCKIELKSMSGNIEEVIEEIQELVDDLQPMSFDDTGFCEAIERELERIGNTGTAQMHYQIEGNIERLNPTIEMTLFRIIQEGCNNAEKHSNASEITVNVICTEEEIHISIEDNGNGFSIGNTGVGLQMMKERVYLLSGKITIDSSLGRGTKIDVTVPCYNNGWT